MMAGTSPSIAVDDTGTVLGAFQSNTGYLWEYTSFGTGHAGNTLQGMMAGTSPSLATLATGALIAFQANTGDLYLTDFYGNVSDTYFGMAPGASPSILPLHYSSYQIAFKANTGYLWLDIDGTGIPEWFGMN
jgi:hypothetical protein